MTECSSDEAKQALRLRCFPRLANLRREFWGGGRGVESLGTGCGPVLRLHGGLLVLGAFRLMSCLSHIVEDFWTCQPTRD